MLSKNKDVAVWPSEEVAAESDSGQNLCSDWVEAWDSISSTTLLHQLFEMQAEHSPGSIAIRAEEQCLSYQHVNEQANRFAYYLHQQGLIADTVVGLFIDRSPAMVIAMLGILKAGGAYLPLDPDYPSDRTASILAESGVSLVVSYSHLIKNLPQENINVICLDLEQEKIGRQKHINPNFPINVNHLAYVIYTSGSTGTPKGVMIPHKGICNQLFWRQTTFPLTPSDRVLQNISFSFDPSVWQIFWPISCGAQIVLPKPGGQRDIAYLVELIAREQVTILALVPSVLKVFLEQTKGAQSTPLRHVFCGGEALPTTLQDLFINKFGATTQLHNVYGPTEASIDATCWTCQPGLETAIAPIGRPIANAEAYVLDEHLQPVATGDSGELYIGGRGLARGYLKRPDLTAERFIPHPHSSDTETRLYKTGDLVRYRFDGNLEFLGRLDSQVKIRGFRIELQEIEVALTQHRSVAECVVLASQSDIENSCLAAYIVTAGSGRSTAQELNNFLRGRLPDYMVPAHFIFLDELPLNANGKIDKKKLPEPSLDRQAFENDVVSPRNETELRLAQIWEQELQLGPIGITDSFFELGGNSLLAASMLIKVEDVFGRSPSLGNFFQLPTIEALAKALQETSEDNSKQSLVAIQPYGSKSPLFCVHTRTGSVLDYYTLAQQLNREQPIYGLQARGLSSSEDVDYRVEAMARRYIRELQTLQPTGPYFLCGYSFGGLVAYEMAQQLVQEGQTIGLLTLIDTYCLTKSWFDFSTPTILGQLRGKLSAGVRRVHQKWLSLGYLRSHSSEAVLERMMAISERAIRSYKPQPYSGSVLLLRATQLPEKANLSPQFVDETLGWEKLVTGGIKVHSVSGNHFNLFEKPNVFELANYLNRFLP
ncbi:MULTISPECIES: non-ribosomal peptide synthetase [Cyanophyceae]|uniref:Amino acid adenylation domain-containing protein n=1 Tax=Leptolyngbya subtilissima DQ-A4 TaxID=2933933 RepID=A0ABV0KA31_9CYAN|nr:amino acid adenylation domain-containing protein [Nodosilinea sp. FACHB-141]